MKILSRAVRRKRTSSIKIKRKKYWNYTGGQHGTLLETPKVCSCWMCGNPRKYWKYKTLKEKSFDETYNKVELQELDNSQFYSEKDKVDKW